MKKVSLFLMIPLLVALSSCGAQNPQTVEAKKCPHEVTIDGKTYIVYTCSDE